MQKFIDVLAKQMYESSLVRNKGMVKDVDIIALLKECSSNIVDVTQSATKYIRTSYLTEGGTNFNLGSPTKTEKMYKEDKEKFTKCIAENLANLLVIAGKEGLDMTHALTVCLNERHKRNKK